MSFADLPPGLPAPSVHAAAGHLPTFDVEGMTLLKRLTPNAADVLAWLRANPA